MNVYEIERLRVLTNRRNRAKRLSDAKKLGTHTKVDWEEMKDFFEHICVRCFGESELINVEKDHIVSLYQGGSDGIENLQPLCARCNSSKGTENFDWRPIAANRLNKKLPEKYKTNG